MVAVIIFVPDRKDGGVQEKNPLEKVGVIRRRTGKYLRLRRSLLFCFHFLALHVADSTTTFFDFIVLLAHSGSVV